MLKFHGYILSDAPTPPPSSYSPTRKQTPQLLYFLPLSPPSLSFLAIQQHKIFEPERNQAEHEKIGELIKLIAQNRHR